MNESGLTPKCVSHKDPHQASSSEATARHRGQTASAVQRDGAGRKRKISFSVSEGSESTDAFTRGRWWCPPLCLLSGLRWVGCGVVWWFGEYERWFIDRSTHPINFNPTRSSPTHLVLGRVQDQGPAPHAAPLVQIDASPLRPVVLVHQEVDVVTAGPRPYHQREAVRLRVGEARAQDGNDGQAVPCVCIKYGWISVIRRSMPSSSSSRPDQRSTTYCCSRCC